MPIPPYTPDTGGGGEGGAPGPNSVGTAQLQNGAVTPDKLDQQFLDALAAGLASANNNASDAFETVNALALANGIVLDETYQYPLAFKNMGASLDTTLIELAIEQANSFDFPVVYEASIEVGPLRIDVNGDLVETRFRRTIEMAGTVFGGSPPVYRRYLNAQGIAQMTGAASANASILDSTSGSLRSPVIEPGSGWTFEARDLLYGGTAEHNEFVPFDDLYSQYIHYFIQIKATRANVPPVDPDAPGPIVTNVTSPSPETIRVDGTNLTKADSAVIQVDIGGGSLFDLTFFSPTSIYADQNSSNGSTSLDWVDGHIAIKNIELGGRTVEQITLRRQDGGTLLQIDTNQPVAAP